MMVKQSNKPLWPGTGKDRLCWGRLLRVGILLLALCVCAHVYLERGRSGAPPAPLSSGRPTQVSPSQGEAERVPGGERARSESSEPVKPGRAVRRRVSYVRTLKKDPAMARERDGGGGERSPMCCPLPRLHRKALRWHINLEPWASERPSLEDETRRFLHYITTPQVSCGSLANGHAVQKKDSLGAWAVCLDPNYSLWHRVQNKHCRIYSLGLGVEDRSLEFFLAQAGCEVHCFDPSLKQPHLQQRAHMWLHRLSVDWRDPNPAILAQHQHASTKKLATILNDFGHGQVDVLKADMESAEWKILENLILEGVLDSVGQVLLEVHLHWAGFEVSGDDPSVVRYWYSLLKELERANFRLFRSHSDPAKPHLLLHRNVLNASSVYTLGWVNTQWKP